jgi:hypothetical protein
MLKTNDFKYFLRVSLFSGIIVVIPFFISCKNRQTDIKNLKQKDLISEGVPLKIKAPEDAKVDISVDNFYKEITVKNDKGYFINIISNEKLTSDIDSIKNELLGEVKKNPLFGEIFLDEEQGFVFTLKTKEDKINYDFRYIRVDENQQYIFQGGRYGVFTKEQALKMYNSVKQ